MGKKGGKNRLKRLAAPKLWDIERKEKRFVFKPSPGPHPISASYPLGVIVRDIARLVNNARELRYVINSGKVLVDGKIRKSLTFPVGLFDVVSIPAEGLNYRLVPSPKGLVLAKIDEGDAEKKICAIKRKTMIRGGHIQYGLHDGRSLISDSLNLRPGDSVLIKIPAQQVLGSVKLDKGSLAIVVSGERAGQVGRIIEVNSGTITRERMVKIELPSGETEIPSRLVFPIGTKEPLIGLGARYE